MKRTLLGLAAALLPAVVAAVFPAVASAAVVTNWDFVPVEVTCNPQRSGQACIDEANYVREALARVSLTLSLDSASLTGQGLSGPPFAMSSGVDGAVFPDNGIFNGTAFVPSGVLVNLSVTQSGGGLIGSWLWNNGSQDAGMSASSAAAWNGFWNADGPFMTCGPGCRPVFSGYWQQQPVDAPSSFALLALAMLGVAGFLRRRHLGA